MVNNQDGIVIDASVAVNFALPTLPFHESALRLVGQWSSHGVKLVAPTLFESEADSAIRRSAFHGEMTPEAEFETWRNLDALAVSIIYDPRVRSVARSIADESDQLRVYDSTYAALAQLLKCEFWTADRRFYQRVNDRLRFVRFVDEV